MPWRLVLFLLALTFVVFFAGFNLTNVSDISFGFYTFTDIPVFISLFIAFLFGTIVMLPFSMGRRRQRELKNVSAPEKEEVALLEQKPARSKPAKKSRRRVKEEEKMPINEGNDTSL